MSAGLLKSASWRRPKKELLSSVASARPEQLCQTSDGDTPLMLALVCEASDAVIMALLEKAPEAARMADKFGVTPLHVAAARKYSAPVAKKLLALNAQAAKTADADGELPLHRAARYGAPPGTTQLILDQYPEAARTRCKREETPLDKARLHKRAELLAMSWALPLPVPGQRPRDLGAAAAARVVAWAS